LTSPPAPVEHLLRRQAMPPCHRADGGAGHFGLGADPDLLFCIPDAPSAGAREDPDSGPAPI
jgi:hypothetical protein